MKILVTGGTGFIGSAVVRHLLAAGHEVRVLTRCKRNRFLLEGLDVEVVDGDVTRSNAVDKAVQGCSVVFDLASIYSFYPFWEKKARALYKTNVQGTINLLEASLKYGVKRFIHTSSIATIGKRSDGKPSDEETGFDFDGAIHYARSKYLAEQEVFKYCKKGLNAVILNPAIVIGERDYKPTPSGEVIVKFLNRSYPGYFDTLWAFADVDDVARAHLAAIERGQAGERYILCNKKHMTLKEIFHALEKISGIKSPRIRIPNSLLFGIIYLDELFSFFLLRKKPLLPSEGVRFCKMSIRYDNAKAVRELGYVSTPVEETLGKAVSWYRKNGYVAPRGIFRIKAGGLKVVKAVMASMGMDKMTEKFNLGTVVLYLAIRFLYLLRTIGFRPKEDSWRKVTRSYLRTEHSKFALAGFGLDFWSDMSSGDERSMTSAKEHLIQRFAQFLKQYPATHFSVAWHRFSAKRKAKTSIDIVCADFNEAGKLTRLEPYLDLAEQPGRFSQLSSELKNDLIQAVIRNYNKTKNCADKKRPLALKRKLDRWCFAQPRIPAEARDEAGHFIERILSATFIAFEKMTEKTSADCSRFHAPSFINYKHPGFGLMNIVCRLSHDLRWADLWIQFNHIPIDGVPAQEMLNDLKRQWGKQSDLRFPANDNGENVLADLCSTENGKNAIYHTSQFLDFRPFLKLRRELNKRFAGAARENITSAALLIWKLAQYQEFEDIKFCVPIDVRKTNLHERTLRFVFIRPSTYLDRDKPDRGFFRFQKDFNRSLRSARKRKSESCKLLDSFAVVPPILYTATIKLMPAVLRDFVGTVGITIIKKADFFIAPYTDVHTDGFIAFSNFSLPTEDGGKVCVVNIKGSKEKARKYVNIFNDIMNRAIKNDELYI